MAVTVIIGYGRCAWHHLIVQVKVAPETRAVIGREPATVAENQFRLFFLAVIWSPVFHKGGIGIVPVPVQTRQNFRLYLELVLLQIKPSGPAQSIVSFSYVSVFFAKVTHRNDCLVAESATMH